MVWSISRRPCAIPIIRPRCCPSGTAAITCIRATPAICTWATASTCHFSIRRADMDLDIVTNEELIQAARRRLNQGAWDYLVGGSESETTLRRNRLAFDRIAFRPRILVDVSKVDPSTTFLSQKLRIPVILAPIGSLQRFDPEG